MLKKYPLKWLKWTHLKGVHHAGVPSREVSQPRIRSFYHDEGMIKVITGVRRCGKSCIMLSIADELRDSGIPDENIAFIDLDLRINRKVKTPDALEELIDRTVSPDAQGTKYLFIDEIQNVRGFEELVNGYRTDGGWSIFITGLSLIHISEPTRH